MVSLGQKISILRVERGLSVKTLAANAGVGTTTVDRIEHNRGGVHPDTLRKIALALHEEAALSEADAADLADASRLSRQAVADLLRRSRPLTQVGSPGVVSPERWRTRCHSLVDRMLAAASDPSQVEVALVAMLAAFESSGGPSQKSAAG